MISKIKEIIFTESMICFAYLDSITMYSDTLITIWTLRWSGTSPFTFMFENEENPVKTCGMYRRVSESESRWNLQFCAWNLPAIMRSFYRLFICLSSKLFTLMKFEKWCRILHNHTIGASLEGLILVFFVLILFIHLILYFNI